MNPSKDLIWGRYALNSKRITRAQLQLCIEELGHLREDGIDKSLSQIMLEHQFVDAAAAHQIAQLEGMIPGYSMKDILGAGGLGVVYRAYSEKLGKEVAIKILNPEYTDNALVLNRFLREIDISKRLDHPNIVKGLDSGRLDDLYYLAMEYIAGDNLATYVSKFGPMNEEQTLSVAVMVTHALCYAWQNGLTHRDIKPENLLLTQAGSLKVCDFGLAKLADANVAITMSGTIVGSPYYISPEQVTGGVHLDYRSDIYSLGATLYFLATGRLLFEEKTVIAFCNAHLNKEPVPPSRFASVSGSLDHLVLRMLNKDPQRRCHTPEEFVSYLLSVITQNYPNKSLPLPIRPPQAGSRETPVMLPAGTSPASHHQEGTVLETVFEEETLEDSFQILANPTPAGQSSRLPPTKALPKTTKDQSTRKLAQQEGSQPIIVGQIGQTKATAKSTALKKDTSITQYPKSKIEDAILQQLLLSLSLMDMSQFSQILSRQVELQLQGQTQSLAELIVALGYIDSSQMSNLRLLRDKNGTSLITGYEIVRFLGEGGVSIVYLARQVATNSTVALKVFAPNMANNSSAVVRFMREAEAAKRLDHPNIVKANDFGNIHGIYYLAMEYIPGLSLSQIISKVGRLEEKRALDILYQLAEALTYAWKQNIIHRDIKPGNILSDGEVFKICDLGLAKALESEIQLTQEGSVIGTPQFMSPEQFQPEKELDFRSDIYSLGVTFYVMLTGRLPFSANTKLGLAQAHLLKDPPPLEKFDVQVSKPTKALLTKMMAKEAEHRCHDKDELLEDIWRVQQGKYPAHVAADILLTPKAVALALLLAVLVGVTSGGYWMFQKSQENQRQEVAYQARLAKVEQLLAQHQYAQAEQIIGEPGLAASRQETLLARTQEARKKHAAWLESIEPPDMQPPTIVILQPDGVQPGKRISVAERQVIIKGYATDNEQVDAVWINDQRVPVLIQKQQASFEAPIQLGEGEQPLTIRAQDHNGNEARLAFLITIPRLGWFGEAVPDNLSKGSKIGEYLSSPDEAVMVYVPAGEFWYGEEKNARKVYLTGYYIDKYEVTWQQYQKFCQATGYPYPSPPSWGIKASQPVVQVVARDILAYAKWCNKSMPTVAQWIKAARGGVKIPDWQAKADVIRLSDNPLPFRLYPWGNEAPNALFQGEKTYRCNYCADDSFVGQASDGYMYAARVGDFSPWDSPYHACDMAGNVAEICLEWPAPEEGNDDKSYAILGGNFLSLAKHCTVLARDKIAATRSQSQAGFRLIK